MLIIGFKTEYLWNFQDVNTAHKLWIWYYYTTEEYDRNLPHTVQSEYDKDTVIPIYKSRGQSEKYAINCWRHIFYIAEVLKIDFDLMNTEKHSLSGRKQEYIDEQYQYLKENGGLEFMKQFYNSLLLQN